MTDAGSLLAFDASLGFAANPLDRVEARRNDAAFVRQLRDSSGAAAVVFAGDAVVLPRHDAPWFPLAEAARFGPPTTDVLLGVQEGGQGCFALAFSEADVEALATDPGVVISDLRTLATSAALPPAALGALAQAKAVLSWHRFHRFCAHCGTPTGVAGAGWRRECGQCGLHHFPRTDPVVIMMAVDGERCLLGRQPRFPAGMYSCLAGFLEPGETIEDAVRRELFEEAGISTGPVRYLGSQPWPFPSSLMIGCIAQATSTGLTVDPGELEDARWFDRAETRALLEERHPAGLRCPAPMAIAHHLMRAWAFGTATGDEDGGHPTRF